MTRGDGDFLSRWSTRKLKARDESETDTAPQPAPPEAAPPAAPPPDLSGKSDEEILQALGLPNPDMLQKGDDFSAFLKSAVPAGLRNRALRRLWRSNPVLANLDGLNDYDGDYTDAATVVKGGLKTAYRVGRGFLRDEDEAVAAADPAGTAADPAAEPAPADAAASDPHPAAAAPEDRVPAQEETPDAGPTRDGTAEAPADAAGLHASAAGPAQDGADATLPRPSRMRFHFDRG